MSFKKWLMVPSLCLALGSTAFAGGDYVGERNSFNRFHGNGTYTYSNGARYDGQWIDGRKQGHGKQTLADGSVYEGEWRDNLQNGKGRMVWANGDIYEGSWSDGRMNGYGRLQFANGDRFEGQFVSGRRDGRGVLTLTNGARFEGNWKDDQRQGRGKLTKPGWGVIEGVWASNQPADFMTVTFADGDRFIGGLKNEMPHGKGACVSKTGEIVCEYDEGQRLAAAPVVPANAQAGRSSIVNKTPGVSKPVTQADIIRRTAAVMAINTAPATAAGFRPGISTRSAPASTFSYLLDDTNEAAARELPRAYAVKEDGNVRIRAEGTELVTLMIDQYSGPGTYPLKFFKGAVAEEGMASYQTSAAEPGEIEVIADDDGVLKGLFRFVGYRNGNPATQEKIVLSSGRFEVPVRVASGAVD